MIGGIGFDRRAHGVRERSRILAPPGSTQRSVPTSSVAVSYEMRPPGRTLQRRSRALYGWMLDDLPALEAARAVFGTRAQETSSRGSDGPAEARA